MVCSLNSYTNLSYIKTCTVYKMQMLNNIEMVPVISKIICIIKTDAIEFMKVLNVLKWFIKYFCLPSFFLFLSHVLST